MRIYCALRLLCASTALDLQMDRADVRLQRAGRPERHAFAVSVRAGVVSALLVHRFDVRLQADLVPKGDAGAVGARVVPALQFSNIDTRSSLIIIF